MESALVNIRTRAEYHAHLGYGRMGVSDWMSGGGDVRFTVGTYVIVSKIHQ